MIHVLFDRPSGKLKAFVDTGVQVYGDVDAAGDAWGAATGNGGRPPYGTDYPCPPGHYLLTQVEWFPTPVDSEGYGQIYVSDLDGEHAALLISAQKASRDGLQLNIGGITLPIGNLASYGRSAIMMHGGGSNDPDPLADFQPLLKTYGCTRLHNADWKEFAFKVNSWRTAHTVVYSIIGQPIALPD